MLDKPDIPDASIVACLADHYGLSISRVSFLPVGADLNSALYRVEGGDHAPYFLKLRLGDFDETAVALPEFLWGQGLRQIIRPVTTAAGRLWAPLASFTAILYPFVDGHNGYEVRLSDAHWIELGAAVHAVHTAALPEALAARIRRETFPPQWRESVRLHFERIDAYGRGDAIVAQMAHWLGGRQAQLSELVRRADVLAHALQARPTQFVLCHSDVHAGNVFIDARDALFIVDWDNPILAPKERDLMFAGGGQFGAARSPQEEEVLFYRGYGQTRIDQAALAYYRYERIVQDVALFCDQITSTASGEHDRAQALRYLASNFALGGTLEIAIRADTGAWAAPGLD